MKKPPPGLTAGALRNDVVFAADHFEIAPSRLEYQSLRLRSRFGLSSALAAEVAALAFGRPEHWSRRL